MNAIPYGKQSITEEDIQAVCQILREDYLTQGPRIAAFEKAFAQYIGSQYAVAVANGTAALHLCTLSLGLSSGQRVICSPMTFVASANCVRYAGGTVDFVDIDVHTGLMDLNRLAEQLAQAETDPYVGIIPVDYMGLAVDMERVRMLADQYGCWVIEDSCHAPGGYFTDNKGNIQRCGSGQFADLAIFSFHPVKHIACGEGGMITTNDPDLYERLRMLRQHGITKQASQFEGVAESPGGWYYEMQALGFNYRLSDIHAGLGLAQLGRAAAGLARRRELARRYDEAFDGSPIHSPPAHPGHAYHLYVIRVPNRKRLYDHLRANRIYAQVHYIPVHYQPYYQSLGWRKGDFPQAESWYDHCLSIPMYPTLTNQEQDFVIEKVFEGI